MKIKNNGRDGFEMVLLNMFDLILFDIMLLEMSGIEVLCKVRKRENYVFIIFLIVCNLILDKILGLD